LGTLFETPIAPRSASNRRDVVVDDTPIKSRLPLGMAADGGNRVGAVKVKEKVGVFRGDGSDSAGSGGVNENGNGYGNGTGTGKLHGTGSSGADGLSIYQRLGWDTTDLDDIDDLL